MVRACASCCGFTNITDVTTGRRKTCYSRAYTDMKAADMSPPNVAPGEAPMVLRTLRVRSLMLLMALSLSACVASDHLVQELRPEPVFDAVAFFAGETRGEGALKIIFKPKVPAHVEGHGTIAADGSIVLDQDVRIGAAAPTHRTWHLQRIGRDRYTGTLTDAIGPVAGDVSNNRLHLSFAMKNGLHVQQWLYLQPGGQVARNRMVVTKFGVAVASLDEIIRRQQP